MSIIVNDVHSKLNETRMRSVTRPATVEALCDVVRAAASDGRSLSICGARHAMGGQQFLTDGSLVDCSALDRVVAFDDERGLVTAEAGITWRPLIEAVHARQRALHPDREPAWGIVQKQTGADDLTLGGAVAANAHGRALTRPPLVSDIESLEVIDARGELLACSRHERPELFALVVGGYGLAGVIARVTLRLAERRRIRRIVRLIDLDDAVPSVRRRIEEGAIYGDFQFDVDAASPSFLTKGVFSCYEPCADEGLRGDGIELSADAWRTLLTLAHTDKQEAFRRYAAHYVMTDGQAYWSDTHQLGVYLPDYHVELDRALGVTCPGSEMITELYVPHDRLVDFMHAAAAYLVGRGTSVIYGTIRLIRADTETMLPWARQDSACVIFNLHVDHSPAGIEHAAESFRGLIDLALERGGSFFLTYHRFARRDQLLAAYPEAPAFLRRRDELDPGRVFESDWGRWLRETLG